METLRTRAPSFRPTWLVAASALALLGCDNKDSKLDELVSAAQVDSAAPTDKPRGIHFDKIPEISIDTLGAYIGGHRAKLGDAAGAAKLKEVSAKLPINDKPVPVKVDKGAKIEHVAAVVEALGEAGAPVVVITTTGRADLPRLLRVTPKARLSNPEPCSIATTVNSDSATGVWSINGGGGKKHTKGQAGPDLTRTSESIMKDLAHCDSRTAFFSADNSFKWELAYNMGAVVAHSAAKMAASKDECSGLDEKTSKKLQGDTLNYADLTPEVAEKLADCAAKRIDKLVLLADGPVAGRPVKL